MAYQAAFLYGPLCQSVDAPLVESIDTDSPWSFAWNNNLLSGYRQSELFMENYSSNEEAFAL